MSRPEKIGSNLIGFKQDLGTYTFTHKDFILYALGIGFSTDPLNLNDLKYTYQREKDFKTFPTFASCLGQQKGLDLFLTNTLFPKFKFYDILHGEQRLHLVHPSLKVNSKYQVQSQIIDIIDRGQDKGVFIGSRLSGYLLNQQGQRDLAYYLDRVTFIRSLGGSGVKSTGKILPLPPVPKKQPDVILKDKTFPNQAILYRLNSDLNPLHIEPANAKLAGFPKPIIHGLATYGTIVRSIVQNLLQNDATKIKSTELRFTGFVFPGQSFEIKIWKGPNRLLFEATIVERGTKAVSGVITLRDSAKL